MWRWVRPQSIFASIYGGLLLVILTVSLCTYASVSYLNGLRAREYMENMATAIFHIAAISIARQPDENRTFWLEDASHLLGMTMELQSRLPFEPDRRERERLDASMAVVRQKSGLNEAWIRVPLPGQSVYLHTFFSGIGEKQARAAAIFYLEDLSNYPGQENIRLRTLSPYVGFAMSLIDRRHSGLDGDQLHRLAQDEIVVRFGEMTSNGRSAITVYAPSQEARDKLLVFGPIELYEPLSVSLLVTAAVLALLFITLGAYLIIHVFEVKIGRLESTVRRLREGDLSARADVEGADELARLAQTLDQMAAHIQRLLDAQRELTQAVSHELRTPLARLRFGMEMLAESDDIEDRYEQLDRLDEDVAQLNQLIDEILTYANLEKGTPDLHFEPVDMDELLGRIARETLALRKPATLEVRCEPAGLVVDAVPRYMHRVIQNLVGNALRYAGSRVRATVMRDGAHAVLMVEDDGPGIPEADRSRVFEPFTRLDDSRTRSTGGYGLGLSIVNRIVYWFQGEIFVDRSESLGGARFVMRWPLKRQA